MTPHCPDQSDFGADAPSARVSVPAPPPDKTNGGRSRQGRDRVAADTISEICMACTAHSRSSETSAGVGKAAKRPTTVPKGATLGRTVVVVTGVTLLCPVALRLRNVM